MKRLVLLAVFFLFFGICAGAQGYQTYLEQGKKMFNSGLYDDAITCFDAAKLKTAGDKEGAAVVSDWLGRAQRAKASAEKLSVAQDTVYFFSGGGEIDLAISSRSPVTIESKPEWCAIEMEVSSMKLIVSANNSREPRVGEITLKMTVPKMSSNGKSRVKEAVVYINQDARAAQVRNVVFHSVPSGVAVSLPDDGQSGLCTDIFVMKEGAHRVVFTKAFYKSLEMVCTIAPDEPEGTKFIDVKLEPSFAVVQIDLKSSDVKALSKDNDPRVRLGRYSIDVGALLSGEQLPSIEDEEIQYGRVYNGGLVPLPDGDYIISAEARGFENYSQRVSLHGGVEQGLEIVMNPIKGSVRIIDGGGAEGARIFVDRIDMGVVPTTLHIPADFHSIVLEKDGYVSDKRSYSVEVLENGEESLVVSMKPFSWVSFDSDPPGAALSVAGQIYYTPTMWRKIPQGLQRVKVSKDGYMTQWHNVNVGTDSLSLTYNLVESHPLSISADERSLHLTLIDQDGIVAVCDSLLPTVVDIPYGKYKMELRRYNSRAYKAGEPAKTAETIPPTNIEAATGMKDLAYKGNLNFTPKMTSVTRHTYTTNGNFNLLHGLYWLSSQQIAVKNAPAGLTITPQAAASFLRFSLFPGYTTSLAKATMFNVANPGVWPQKLFTGTVLFLNGELRFGGSLMDTADLSLLGSYYWMPDLTDAVSINMSYVNGTEFFVGLELSSRFPTFDFSLRAGEQFWNGTVNYYSGSHNGHSHAIYERYPFANYSFVIGATFSIGASSTKGQSIVRLW